MTCTKLKKIAYKENIISSIRKLAIKQFLNKICRKKCIERLRRKAKIRNEHFVDYSQFK